MKVYQVLEAVTALGFLTDESKEAYRDNMLLSLDRAVKTVANEVAAEHGEISFIHKPQENCFDALQLIQYTGEPLRFFADGIKCYSFLCDGTGRAIVSSEGGTEVIELSSGGEFVLYRGFVSGDTEIVFEGEYSYTIKNLSGYKERRSEDTYDIHGYDDFVCYDLERLTKEGENIRFGALFEKPIFIGEGRAKRDVLSYTVGSKVFIKSTDSFVVLVKYKKQPITIDSTTSGDFEIELPQRVLILLPLLTAFYLLRDDEPTMADIYYNDYEIKKNNLILSDSTPIATVVEGESYADSYLR